ncbi:hypothetical protein SCG7109_AG_00240 [Chlamydiales bacterium SCGC AG-110-M15]|nr:hypothetical protein SCG7109_AG_00240 [Chlamydiales bacterium SCGC AG-110-M15]
MEAFDSELQSIYLALICVACVLLVHYKTQVLHLDADSIPLPRVRFSDLIIPLGIYIVLSTTLYAFAYLLLNSIGWVDPDLPDDLVLESFHPYIEMVIMSICLLCMLAYCKYSPEGYLDHFFWNITHERSWRFLGYNLFLGVKTYFSAFPFVFLMNALCVLFYAIFIGEVIEEQEAVSFFIKSIDNHSDLFFSILLIIFIIPLLEEIIFRGFIHSSLRQYLGRFWGMITSSSIFALFHFSTGQGWKNLEIVLSLFVLSLFITWTFEKRRTLMAPLGLHMTFNAVSVVALSLTH